MIIAEKTEAVRAKCSVWLSGDQKRKNGIKSMYQSSMHVITVEKISDVCKEMMDSCKEIGWGGSREGQPTKTNNFIRKINKK